MRKYRRISNKVEAIQLNENNIDNIYNILGADNISVTCRDSVFIKTPEGIMQAKFSDYIIKGIEGECYPCKESVFLKLYSLDKEND